MKCLTLVKRRHRNRAITFTKSLWLKKSDWGPDRYCCPYLERLWWEWGAVGLGCILKEEQEGQLEGLHMK